MGIGKLSFFQKNLKAPFYSNNKRQLCFAEAEKSRRNTAKLILPGRVKKNLLDLDLAEGLSVIGRSISKMDEYFEILRVEL